MSANDITSAMACDFDHVTAPVDVEPAFPSGVSVVAVNLASGAYRMWLAPSAGCYLRALAAAMQLAMNTIRSPEVYTVTASLSAAGIATLRIASASEALDPPRPGTAEHFVLRVKFLLQTRALLCQQGCRVGLPIPLTNITRWSVLSRRTSDISPPSGAR